MRRGIARFAVVLLASVPAMARSEPEPLNLALPTENDAIYRGNGPEFYQYVDRDYKGEKETPGRVANPRSCAGDQAESLAGLVYTRLNEPLDIRLATPRERASDRSRERDCAGWSSTKTGAEIPNYGRLWWGEQGGRLK